MLRNTLILPETDARHAARLLRDAVDDLEVVLMLVFGKDDRAKQVVGLADRLCRGMRVEQGTELRRVVWIRRTDAASIREVLNSLLEEERLPLVAVLDFFDEVRGTLPPDAEPTPIDLERLFLQGHKR